MSVCIIFLVGMILSLLTFCFVCTAARAATTTADPGESSYLSPPDNRHLPGQTSPSVAKIGAAIGAAMPACAEQPVSTVTQSDIPVSASATEVALVAEDVLVTTTVAPTSWLDTIPVIRKSQTVKSVGPHFVGDASSKAPVVGLEFGSRLLPLEGPVDVVFVEHQYPEEYLVSLGPRTRRMVEDQVTEDLAKRSHTPLLEHDSEMVTDATGTLLQLVIGEMVGRTSEAVLFEVKPYSGLLIKYQADCSSLAAGDLVHPLVRDSWILRKLEALNLSPKVYAVSPPTWLSVQVTPKTNFIMSRRRRAEYAGKCTVRYMLMDRVGESSHSYVNAQLKASQPLDLLMALSVMKEVLKGLRRIHAMGIVHGDIHAGNILLHDKGNGHETIKFIDFGRSFLAEQMMGKPANISEPLLFSHPLLSHWDLLGFRSSYRDDVFKALWLGSFLMNGPALNDHVQWLGSNPRIVVAFKRDAYWFDVPGRRSILESIPFRIRKPVKEGLQRVLDLVRGIDGVDVVPNHAEIITQLRHIIELVKRQQ